MENLTEKHQTMGWIDYIDNLQVKIAGICKLGKETADKITEYQKTMGRSALLRVCHHYLLREVITDIARKRLMEVYYVNPPRKYPEGTIKCMREIILGRRWKCHLGILKAMPIFLLEIGIITILALVKNMLSLFFLPFSEYPHQAI